MLEKNQRLLWNCWNIYDKATILHFRSAILTFFILQQTWNICNIQSYESYWLKFAHSQKNWSEHQKTRLFVYLRNFSFFFLRERLAFFSADMYVKRNNSCSFRFSQKLGYYSHLTHEQNLFIFQLYVRSQKFSKNSQQTSIFFKCGLVPLN